MKANEAKALMVARARAEMATMGILPTQAETIDGHPLRWLAQWTEPSDGKDCHLRGKYVARMEIGAVTLRTGDVLRASPAFWARMMEVRAALDAWERNEGDWPLARKPETKE